MEMLRVAVADVHPLYRLGVRYLVEREDDLVWAGEAGSTREALALASRADVLLLGMNLPDDGSPIVAESVHASFASSPDPKPTRVLAMSAREEEELMFEMLARRVAGYLSKAEPPEVVLHAVRGAARGGGGFFSTEFVARAAPRSRVTARDAELLSPRETEVLRLVAVGQNNRAVADALFISPDTVKNHVTSIFGKLDVRTRAEAVAWAWRNGLAHTAP